MDIAIQAGKVAQVANNIDTANAMQVVDEAITSITFTIGINKKFNFCFDYE